MTAFHVGDVIRKARIAKKLSQAALGRKASEFRLRETDKPIDKSTVGAIEAFPFLSGFDVIVRLLAALELPMSQAFRDVGEPTFLAKAPPSGKAAVTKKRAG